MEQRQEPHPPRKRERSGGDRVRNWVFRISFTENAPLFQIDESDVPEWITYIVWQLEVGEDTHVEHLQGYLECSGQKTMQQLLALPFFAVQAEGYSVHLAPRRGTQEQAIRYARKEDTRVDGPWELGVAKEQGKRSDLLQMKASVDEGALERALWESNFSSMVRYHRSIKEYKRISRPPRTWLTHFYILCGNSGVGKSRLAAEAFGVAPLTYWKPNSKWWDDYDAQEIVVWDEFRGAYPYQDLLRILDGTPLTVESKGGSCQFLAKLVVFTTNFHPQDWYRPEVTGHPIWEGSPLERRLREYGQLQIIGDRPPPRFARVGIDANGHAFADVVPLVDGQLYH